MTDSHTADIRPYLQILWRRKLLALSILVVIPLATYLVVSREQKIYASSVLMKVQTQPIDVSLFQTPAPPTPAQEALNSAARLITTTAVAEDAGKRLEPPVTRGASLLSQVTATPDTSSGFITITARAAEPQRAADIANVFAETVVRRRARAARGSLDRAIAQVKSELRGLEPDDSDGHRQLSQQLQRFRALKAAQGTNAQIIEAAVPNPVAVSPRIRRTTILAFVVALLLAMGAVVLREGTDRVIRDPEEVEALSGLPLLTTVPRSAFNGQPPTALEEEAYHMLRGGLRYFNVDRTIDSIVVASPTKGDGKTTVAIGLARAAVRAGMDVILVDADLRLPQVADRLGLKQGRGGLAPVLIGAVSLDAALTEVHVEGDGPLLGRLRVLPAGPPPPNPSELLSSSRMRALLEVLTDRSELLIVDTNPILAVSDSLPLFDAASGLVIVARLNRTPRDAVKKLLKVIETTGGLPLGVVVSGTQTGGLYARSYGYGYGYVGRQADTAATNGHVAPAGALADLPRRRDDRLPAAPPEA